MNARVDSRATKAAHRGHTDGAAFAVTNDQQRGWLLTDRDYTDFVLRLEYQLTAGANSGVALRMPPGAKKLSRSPVLVLKKDRVPTIPTLMTPSGNGIIQNQPCWKRCMVIIPSALPLRRGTLRKCPKRAAVLLRLSTRFNPRRLRSRVSRPEASTR